MKELPVNWSEIEKACLAGVPMLDVAKGVADKTPELGPDATKRLYTAIRKRSSRERWALPDSIVRRAQAQARVAAGVAKDAKEGARWQAGVDNLDQVQQSRDFAGVGVPRSFIEIDEQQASPAENEQGTKAPAGAGIAVAGGGGALLAAPPTATELVTQSLATRGQTGLSLALDAALASLQSLQSSGDTVPIRSMQDLLTAVKATQAAAGLDKPAVAVAVSLNNGANASITAWECVDSV